MFSDFLKNLSILKKFLFINLIIFLANIVNKQILRSDGYRHNTDFKKNNYFKIINNTIDHILRLILNLKRKILENFYFQQDFYFKI